MKNLLNVILFISFFAFISFSADETQAQVCYVKKDIEDGSLSVRDGQSIKADEVLTLLAGTAVKCQRSGEWLTIKGKDKDGNPKDFYFYDNAKYFEDSNFVSSVKVNPDKINGVSVFNKTGETYKSCAENPYNAETNTGCKSVSWPDENSKLDILDSSVDWNKQKNRYEVYYQVRSRYARKVTDPKTNTTKTFSNDEIGWVSASDLVFGQPADLKPTPTQAVVKEQATQVEPVPPIIKPVELNQPLACPIKQAPKLSLQIEALSVASLEEKVSFSFNVLKPVLGECLLTPDGPPTTRVEGTGKNRRVYKVEPKMLMPQSNGYYEPFDNYMMAGYWDKKINKDITYNIPSESGEPVSFKQLIAIDAMARTIYGEMGVCSDKREWDKYFQAVARISLNRVNAIHSPKPRVQAEARGRFMKPDSKENFLDLKDDITRVVNEPSSYSVWNHTSDPNPSNLKQVLCPPAQRNKRMYDGSDMTKLDGADFLQRSMWEHALRYATEAVLFPTALKERTDGLEANYYTSNLKMDGGALIEEPVMNGFTDFDPYCINFWREKGTLL